jgi:gluconolactonase
MAHVSVLRDAGLSALAVADSLELLAEGLQFTEGPLELPDGSLLFQDIRVERTYRLAGASAGAPALVREHTRAANGQTFGPGGTVVFCEQNGRRLSLMNPDGSGVATLVETWQGARLNSPNDVVAHSSGRLYFTDPAYGVAPEERALHFQGVYALDTSGSLHLMLDDFEKPNGLAFSADERRLYVCDTGHYHVRVFDLEPSGDIVVGTGRVFATQDPGKPGGPDGMKVDRAGRVYVAVALGVWVYESDGRLLGILELPERPSNLAWRGPDASTLAITAVDKVYQVRLKVEGLKPPFLPHR